MVVGWMIQGKAFSIEMVTPISLPSCDCFCGVVSLDASNVGERRFEN